jgi:hypothetical protein
MQLVLMLVAIMIKCLRGVVLLGKDIRLGDKWICT